MTDLTPEVLAIHQWIRDDAPVSMKMTITPKLIAALAERLQAARAEGLRSPSGGGEGGEGFIPERVTGGCADAGSLPALAPNREAFEAWYCADAALRGLTFFPADIADLRDGNGYGDRGALNGKWEMWQALVPILLNGYQANRLTEAQRQLIDWFGQWVDDYADGDGPAVEALIAVNDLLKSVSTHDGGEAVHARPLSAASATPKDSLSGPTGEVGGVEPVACVYIRRDAEATDFAFDVLPNAAWDYLESPVMLYAAPPSREA